MVAPEAGNQAGLHGAGLAGPTRADERREAGRTQDTRNETIDELLLPEEPAVIGLPERTQAEVGILHPSLTDARRRRCDRRVEVGVLQEDLFLQPTQARRRQDAEFLAEHVARGPVSAQGVSLSPGAIEGDHVEGAQLFTVRMGARQPVELDHHLGVAAGGEARLHQPLDCDEAELAQSRRLGMECRMHRQVVERHPTPEGERCFERICAPVGVGRSRCKPFGDQRFELERVEDVPIGLNPVTGTDPLDHRSQQLAQLRDVRLHGVAGAVGWVVAPQSVDQPVDGHDGVGVREQECEHQALLGSTECEGRVASPGHRSHACRGDHSRGTEHLESHRRIVDAVSPRRIRHIRAGGATFHDWIVSEPGRKLIGTVESAQVTRSTRFRPRSCVSPIGPSHRRKYTGGAPADTGGTQMNHERHTRRITRLLVVAGAGVTLGLATTYAVAAGSGSDHVRAPSEQTEIAAWATERHLSGLSPASLAPANGSAAHPAAHMKALADYARQHRLTGLSPASLAPANGSAAHPAAHMQALADYARQHRLTGLSPASLRPIDD